MYFNCITLRAFYVNVDQYLYDTQNDYYQWYFQQGDRVREIVKEEDGSWSEETFIGYRTTVAQMRRRLQLNGYDRTALERDWTDPAPVDDPAL
jgi:hypothetical protein